MKDMNSHERLVKNKRKHPSSETAFESSDSDKETMPVIKQEVMSDSSNEEEASQTKSKKRKHQHHHHHHHKRRHKERDNGRERHDENREERVMENHSTSRHQHSSHRRHGEDHVRPRAEEERISRSSRHRHHRDESGDRLRHHRKRDGEDRHRRLDTSRTRRSSTDHENRDQTNEHHERRGHFGGRHARNGDQSSFKSNRPIKKERNSEEKQYEWGKPSTAETEDKIIPPEEREKPNFELSGKLAQETNTFNGVVLKYSEPSEARKPKRRWRFYPFKGDQGLPTLYLHRQSCYLIGRDRKVADIPVDHPSCSKQHAALQYRLVPYTRDDGSTGRRVRPYLIDLESANGTYVNNKQIEGKKYVELLEKDVVKFGYSSREYVLLHEESKEDALDDDVTGAQT